MNKCIYISNEKSGNVKIMGDAIINKTGFGFCLLNIESVLVQFGKRNVNILCDSIYTTSYYPTNKTLLSISGQKRLLFETVEAGMCMKILRGGSGNNYTYTIEFGNLTMKVISKKGLSLSKFSNELSIHSNELSFHKELVS